jgi:hypothetical protein
MPSKTQHSCAQVLAFRGALSDRLPSEELVERSQLLRALFWPAAMIPEVFSILRGPVLKCWTVKDDGKRRECLPVETFVFR